MAELIQEYSSTVSDARGGTYRVRAWGENRNDGNWAAWLEFVPETGGPPLRTERETIQPDRQSIRYWASGLEPVYFEGALARARSSTS